MSAYSDLYVSGVMNMQGKLFFIIRDELPGVDEKWFIERFMCSHARTMLDIGNPKYLNSPPKEMLLRFMEDEMGGEYVKGEAWGGFLPEWCGKIYALFQWKYNVKSCDLVKFIPLSEIERVFPALHQMGWEAAVEKLQEIYAHFLNCF